MSFLNYKFTDLFGGIDKIRDIFMKYDELDYKSKYEDLYHKSIHLVASQLGYVNSDDLINSSDEDTKFKFLLKVFVPETGNASTKFGEFIKSLNYLYSIIGYFMNHDVIDGEDDYLIEVKDIINDNWITMQTYARLDGFKEVFNLNKCYNWDIVGLCDIKNIISTISLSKGGHEIHGIRIAYYNAVSEFIHSIVKFTFNSNPMYSYVTRYPISNNFFTKLQLLDKSI